MKHSHMTCASIATSVLVLTACSLAPIAVPPATSSPDHYGVISQPVKTVEAANITRRSDAGATSVSQWWKFCRSDALNALTEEGLRSNPTLAVIQKTLSVAQEGLRVRVGISTLPPLNAGAQTARQRAPSLTDVDPEALRYNVSVSQLQVHYIFNLFNATHYVSATGAARVSIRNCELETARRIPAANIVGAVISAATLDQQIALTERFVVVADTTA